MLRAIVIIGMLSVATAARTDSPALPLAPGYSQLGYSLPEAGQYQLPPIASAADGDVLDGDGNSRRLYELFGDRYVLLSFMYSSCSDVNGCPLAVRFKHRRFSAGVSTQSRPRPWQRPCL